jgi:hypothetical protein
MAQTSDSIPVVLTGKGVRPSPPSIDRSTKAAMAIVAGILLAGLATPWFPYPAGWIFVVVVVYVVVPLLIMVVLDLSHLRQLRMLARHLEVIPPETEHDHPWINVDQPPLADEYLTRWRSWSRWFGALLVCAALMAALKLPWGVALIPALIGLGAEAFLVVNVLECLVPANWHRLSRREQWRLRACLAAMVVVNASIALAIVATVVFLFVNVPLRWNHFVFTFCFGMLAITCAKRTCRYFGQLRRAVPPDEERAERPV